MENNKKNSLKYRIHNSEEYRDFIEFVLGIFVVSIQTLFAGNWVVQ